MANFKWDECAFLTEIIEGFKLHAPSDQHHVPLQEEHHHALDGPVDSVLILFKEAFISGLFLRMETNSHH
jgi:hypothetical protein